MTFGLNESKIRNSNNIETIKNIFNKPFNESKVMEEFQNPVDMGDDFFKVYLETIDSNTEYKVCIKKPKEVEQIFFNLFHSAVGGVKDKQVAQLIFKKEFDDENEPCWNLQHRSVTSKDIGVSGTDFLKKAEEYLKMLKKNHFINEKNLTVFVSQPSVLVWLQKNGFEFSKINKDNPSDFFELQDGKYVLNKNYEFVDVVDSRTGEAKNPYIIKSDFLLKNSSNEKYIKRNKNGKFYIDEGETKDGEEGASVRQNLALEGGIPRFNLQKEI